MTTREIRDYLYATPFTFEEGERVSDMLGWRRARAALQRLLFPVFTVLTRNRGCSEASLTMRVVCEAIGRRPDPRTLRDLEMLFGLALEAKHPGGNPFGILNVERIRAYAKTNKAPFRASKEYLHNLGYGIGPHYASVLRRFSLIDVNDSPILKGSPERRALSEALGLTGPGRSVDAVVRVSQKWLDDGVNERDLAHLYDALWTPVVRDAAMRTSCWRAFLLGDGHFLQPEYACLRAIANLSFPHGNGGDEPVADAAALRRKVYGLANLHTSDDAQALASIMRARRAFEVVAGVADFWLDALISFSMEEDAHTVGEGLSRNPASGAVPYAPRTLEAFGRRYRRALGALLPKLEVHLQTIEGADRPEMHEMRAFAAGIRERTLIRNDLACATLEAILERHMRVKGSRASVRLGADGKLFFCGRVPEYSGRSTTLLERLEAASDEDPLLKGFSELDEAPTQTDADFKEFVSDLSVWDTFGRWFGLFNDQLRAHV